MRKLIKLFKEVFTSRKTYIAMTQATLFTVPPMLCAYFANKFNEPWLYLHGFLFGLGIIGSCLIAYMTLIEYIITAIKETLSDK